MNKKAWRLEDFERLARESTAFDDECEYSGQHSLCFDGSEFVIVDGPKDARRIADVKFLKDARGMVLELVRRVRELESKT